MNQAIAVSLDLDFGIVTDDSGASYVEKLKVERLKLMRRYYERKESDAPSIRLLGQRMLMTAMAMRQESLGLDGDPVSEVIQDNDPLTETFDNKLSDLDVLRLHEMIFDNAMHLLNDSRVKSKTKLEVLDWIAQPIRPAEEVASLPFSFQACAVCKGLDADTLRQLLLLEVMPNLDIRL